MNKKTAKKTTQKGRSSKYKPLLFTTTLRTPERIKDFLFILYQYDGKILSNDLCTEIMKKLIKYGLYRPMKKSQSVQEKWKSTKSGNFAEYILTDKESEEMLENNPQQHKEAGYEEGWPSRFATQFDIMREFGFAYLSIGEKIEISQIGQHLINSIKVGINESGEIEYEILKPQNEAQAFIHALVKYKRNNPNTKVLNDNSPLILLIEVLNKLNLKYKEKNGLSKLEIPILLYWKNNDSEELFQRIVKLREKYGYSPSWEVICDICRKEIMEGEDIVRDNKSIMIDYPDEFVRKMRITGLISLRGGGRFIDLNKNEKEKIEYVIKTYTSAPNLSTRREYFEYTSSIDENLITLESKKIDTTEQNKLLDKWSRIYDWETIKKELLILSTNRTSKDQVMKILSAPIRLEFLTTLAIKSKFSNVVIEPNYPCDDEGIPTSWALGDQADIICYENQNGILIEVTMAKGTTQTKMEVWPISRHLENFEEKNKKNNILKSMCHFIAPDIFVDTKKQIDWSNDQWKEEGKNLKIKSNTIKEFIDFLESSETLYFEN